MSAQETGYRRPETGARGAAGLLSVDAVAARLRVTRAAVLAAIESGGLLWAFDLAVRQKEKGKRQKEFRACWRLALDGPPASLGALQAAWCGPALKNPTANELARRWGITERHVLNLCAAGCLTEARRGTRGAGHATLIERASALAFLEARRAGGGSRVESRWSREMSFTA